MQVDVNESSCILQAPGSVCILKLYTIKTSNMIGTELNMALHTIGAEVMVMNIHI